MRLRRIVPSCGTVIVSVLMLALCAGLTGCDYFGVLKANIDLGWGGRAIAVALDPANDNFIMAASPTGGVFQSAVGGSAWSHVDALPETDCFDIKFSPDRSNIILVSIIEDTRTANGGGIWRSTDHGKTWTQPPTSIRRAADGSVAPHSAYGISFVGGTHRVVVGTDSGFALSNDFGATWTFIDPQPTATSHAIYSILGLGNNHVITYGDEGIWTSADGATNWTQDTGATPFGGARIANALAVYPLNGNDIFLSDDYENLLYSTDGAHSFTTIKTSPAPSSGIRQPTLKISPASYSSGFDIYWEQATGLNKLHVQQKPTGDLDFSGTWQVVATHHSDPTDLTFSKSGTLIFAANDGGVEKSTDSGNTWSKVGIASNSYDAFQIYDVKVVLSQKTLAENDIYFGTQDNNLYASGDNGQKWPGTVVPEGGRFQGPVSRATDAYTQVHFDDQGPQRYGRLFDTVTYITFPFTQANTVYYVRDNVFFTFAKETETGSAVWVSTDGAQSWTAVKGLSPTQSLVPYATVSGPASNPSLIVPFEDSGTWGLIRIDNAFNSVDNDEVTTSISLPSGAALGIYGEQWLSSIASVGVDPGNPQFIILPDVGNNRIFITSDGGTTWSQRDDLLALITDNGAFKFSTPSSQRENYELSNAQVSAIAFDPSNTGRILIGTAEAGIVYSSDHGATWTKIRGSEQIPNITSFAFTQAKLPQEAFASSWGRGLWTISLDIPPFRRPSPPRRIIYQTNQNNRNGTGQQNPQVRGDADAARKRLADLPPRILIGNLGRSLPTGVVVAGLPVLLTGFHWPSSRGRVSLLRLTLDGVPLRDGLAPRLDDQGKFSLTLRPISLMGLHVLTADLTDAGHAEHVTLKFNVVSSDERDRNRPK